MKKNLHEVNVTKVPRREFPGLSFSEIQLWVRAHFFIVSGVAGVTPGGGSRTSPSQGEASVQRPRVQTVSAIVVHIGVQQLTVYSCGSSQSPNISCI